MNREQRKSEKLSAMVDTLLQNPDHTRLPKNLGCSQCWRKAIRCVLSKISSTVSSSDAGWQCLCCTNRPICNTDQSCSFIGDTAARNQARHWIETPGWNPSPARWPTDRSLGLHWIPSPSPLTTDQTVVGTKRTRGDSDVDLKEPGTPRNDAVPDDLASIASSTSSSSEIIIAQKRQKTADLDTSQLPQRQQQQEHAKIERPITPPPTAGIDVGAVVSQGVKVDGISGEAGQSDQEDQSPYQADGPHEIEIERPVTPPPTAVLAVGAVAVRGLEVEGISRSGEQSTQESMERDAGSRSTATTHLTPLAIELAKFVSTVNMIATERDEFKRTNKHILGQLEASERSHHQELKAARKSWSDLRDQSLRVQEDRAREAQALADQDRALIGELQTLLSQSQAETSDLRKAVAEADEAQQTMKEQLSSSASRLRAEEVTKATLEGLRLDRASALRARDQAIADLQANRQFYQDKVDAAKKTTEEQLISAQQTVKQLSAERSMSETAAEDANQVCNKIREDLRTRTQELDAIQQVVSGQEEDLHALEQQRDELEKAVEEAQERANEVKESMLRDLKALQDKNSTLADQLSTAITSRDQITKSTEDAQKACDDAKREKETTAVHLAAAQAKVTILESGLETLRGTGDKANLALKEANTAATASWEAENAAIDQLEGAREEIIALKASLDKAKLNQDAQDIARQAFEREIDVLKDNLEEAKLEQQTATLSCAKLERSVKVANRACRAADLAKDCAVAEQQELAGKCTTLQDKKAGIQQEADRLAKVAEDAAGKMDKYKKMVEIHKSSGQPNEPMTNAGDFLDKQNKIERLEKRLEKVKKRVMVLEQEKGGGAWRQGTSSTTQDKKPRINGL